MRTHAATPTAEILDGTYVRVYFTTRDSANRSHIGCLELDLREPSKILRLSEEPLLAPGARGAPDQDGAAMGCVVVESGVRRLYYVRWRLDEAVPWRNTIGVAVSRGDSLDFDKQPDPVVRLDDRDPHSVSYPWVLRAGAQWHMWYGSNLAWGRTTDSMQHVVKHASSADGIAWLRDGRAVMALASGEIAHARPCVVLDGDRFRMWYSIRAPGYRMGYAESRDGLSWTRSDEAAGLSPSLGQWDGCEVEYPCVFDAGGHRYMLYNGDDYGRTGFGLAVLD